jgi:hypothetical protein
MTQNTQEIYCEVAGYEEKFPQSFLLKCQGEGIWFTDDNDFCPNNSGICWSFNGCFTYFPCNKETFAKAVAEFKGEPDSITVSKEELRNLLSMSMYAIVHIHTQYYDNDSAANKVMDQWQEVMKDHAVNKDSLSEMQEKWQKLLMKHFG